MSESPEPSRKSLLVTVAFGGVAAALYLLCVVPCADSLARMRREHDDLQFQLHGVLRDLRGSKDVDSRLKALGDGFGLYDAALLKPLLGSWAMRAKSLLDPLAEGVGLKGVDYAELPTRALPVTKPTAERLYARRPIRMTCSGGYAAIVSFLLRVERDFPLVSLQALRIASQREATGDQQAELILEWPVEGGSSLPPKKAKGGKGK